MSQLAEKLAVARAFAETAKDAPMWQKGPAVEHLVKAMLDLLAEIIDHLEGDHSGNA